MSSLREGKSVFNYPPPARSEWVVAFGLLALGVLFLVIDHLAVGLLVTAGGVWALAVALRELATVFVADERSFRRINRFTGRMKEFHWGDVDGLSTDGYGERPGERDYIRYVKLEDRRGRRLEFHSNLTRFVDLLGLLQQYLPTNLNRQPLSELEEECRAGGE